MDDNRFYLHEVIEQNRLLDEGSNTVQGQPQRPKAFANILQNILSASDDVSKVVDENGEPMVVYVMNILNLNLEKYGFRLSDTQVEALIVSSFAEMKRNADMGVTETTETNEVAESTEATQEEETMNRRVMFSRKSLQKELDAIRKEEEEIERKAKADGTYMKAPNGKPTKLNEKQWAQVRTKAFKKWFGDWEKVLRIEKLRKSKPIVTKGDEYVGKYELNKDSAEAYILNNLRDSYINKDSGNKINITRKSVKVMHHDVESDIHLKSVALIPRMLEESIFIDEVANEKGSKFDSYKYYVVGLNINGVDYVAKLAVGVKGNETGSTEKVGW